MSETEQLAHTINVAFSVIGWIAGVYSVLWIFFNIYEFIKDEWLPRNKK